MMANVTIVSGKGTTTDVIWRESLSNGSTVYVASDPRLPGCLSDGISVDEARANLADARRRIAEAGLVGGWAMIDQTHTCPDCNRTLILRMGAEPVACDCAGVTWHLRLVVTRTERGKSVLSAEDFE